jgi:hypothetical protein
MYSSLCGPSGPSFRNSSKCLIVSTHALIMSSKQQTAKANKQKQAKQSKAISLSTKLRPLVYVMLRFRLYILLIFHLIDYYRILYMYIV